MIRAWTTRRLAGRSITGEDIAPAEEKGRAGALSTAAATVRRAFACSANNHLPLREVVKYMLALSKVPGSGTHAGNPRRHIALAASSC